MTLNAHQEWFALVDWNQEEIFLVLACTSESEPDPLKLAILMNEWMNLLKSLKLKTFMNEKYKCKITRLNVDVAQIKVWQQG